MTMRSPGIIICATLALLLCNCCHGFYVPGVKPESFKEGDDVPLKVNAMTSTHTQVPRDYYRLAFCKPPKIKMASENLGEFLTGNKIQNSPYEIKMLEKVSCKILCQVVLTKRNAEDLYKHIKFDYHNNWIVDNLPSAYLAVSTKGEEKTRYAGGFPIGGMNPKTKFAYLNNHVTIHIDYHTVDDGFRVVAFAVEPMSIAHVFADKYEWDGIKEEGFTKSLLTCPSGSSKNQGNVLKPQRVAPGETVLYTYDVVWKESEVEWSSRWDVYLTENQIVQARVHWYSIVNSILVVVFLSLLVVSILVRDLRRDIAAYNALSMLADEEKGEEAEETGWKLVHADVFRPPQNRPMLFCVFCGSGAQLFFTVLFAILLSAVGFLSPARRGSLMIAFLVLYMLAGIVAGYLSSRIYKSFRGRQWQLCTVMTALLFPALVFGVFGFFNIVFFFLHSVASAPLLEVIIVIAMWGCISVPLVFLGAYFGYRADFIDFPTKTSTIARAIPTPAPIMHPFVGMALTGVIPFAAAYVELFFIMTSLWMDQFYYVFGFTLIVYLILVITCAEVTLLLVYYQLCAENHRWWWYSFFCSGSTAIYTFAYSVVWFQTLEASRPMTYLLYFGYMFLISFGMFLLFGTVGALSSLWFVRLIFSTIKVD